MEKICKFIPIEVRSFDEEKGTVEAIVSSEAIDRYGEVIKADAFKKRLKQFMKHPVLLSSHRYSDLRSQIGIWEKVWIEDNALVGKAKYYTSSGNPEADWGFFLAKNGAAAYSVGFLPHEYEDKGYDEDVKSGKKPCRIYTDVELLEISQVLVPANPLALQRSMEKEEDEVYKEYSKKITEFVKSMDSSVIKKFETEEEKEVEEEEVKDLEEETETKPDTENYVHIAAPGEEGKHSGHKIRTLIISEKEGIKSHYCTDCKKITGYLFDKSKGWTHEKAQAWVDKHSKSFEEDCYTPITMEDGDDVLQSVYLTYDLMTEFNEYKNSVKDKEIEKEEDMEKVLEAIAELKTSIDGKFEEVSKFIKEFKVVSEEDLEAENKEIEAKTKETEENYIKKLLEETDNLMAKTISVQP
jgi:hypothetical protein